MAARPERWGWSGALGLTEHSTLPRVANTVGDAPSPGAAITAQRSFALGIVLRDEAYREPFLFFPLFSNVSAQRPCSAAGGFPGWDLET